MLVCQILTVTPGSGVHEASTTRSASRTGRPVHPSETSSRSSSSKVVHGPAVVVATSAQASAGLAKGSG